MTQKLLAALKALWLWVKTFSAKIKERYEEYKARAPHREQARLDKKQRKLARLKVDSEIKREQAKIARANKVINNSRGSSSSNGFSDRVVRSATAKPKDPFEVSDYWK